MDIASPYTMQGHAVTIRNTVFASGARTSGIGDVCGCEPGVTTVCHRFSITVPHLALRRFKIKVDHLDHHGELVSFPHALVKT